MVRITVELLPHGSESAKRKIASMDIINDGTGNIDNGNYKYKIYSVEALGMSKELRNLDVIKYNDDYKNHLRKKGIWSLIHNIFKSIPDNSLDRP